MVVDENLKSCERRYNNRLKVLLDNKDINLKNKEIMKEYLQHYGYKLKRRNGLADVDEKSYKTLYFAIMRLENINNWFKNKTWMDLTEEDIRKVIDDLEDGKIKTKKGTRFTDRSLYYLMLKGDLFELVEKEEFVKKHLKKYGIVGRVDKNPVKFIDEETFRKIVDRVPESLHKLLLWLAWDVGENISSILELEKHEFERQTNSNTNEIEYIVRLNQDKLKTSNCNHLLK